MLLFTTLAFAQDPTPWVGLYKLVESSTQAQAALDAAVAKAVAEFPLLAQPIAQIQLEDAATLCKAYDIKAEAGGWYSKCDALNPVVARTDNKPTTWINAEGDPIEVKVTRTGDAVRVVLKSDSGHRVNAWSFSAGGATLSVEVHSSSLDEPMRWTLHYKAA